MIDNVNYFFKSLMNLKGVGEKFFIALKRLLPNTRYKDILFHLPTDVIDRTNIVSVKDASIGCISTLRVKVIEHIPALKVRGRKLPYKIICADEMENITLTFFNVKDYLKKQLPVGKNICISGKVEDFMGSKTMAHPDYIVPVEMFDKVAVLEPVYPLTFGITNKMIRYLVQEVLKNVPEPPEWQKNPEISFCNALKVLHNPVKDLDVMKKAKNRLIYDEILANQLALALSRKFVKSEKGACVKMTGELTNPLLSSFGYELTNAQKRVWDEIKLDLSSEFKMFRMLQGDVGSGKTIVAMMALLSCVEAGGQGAFMVPTEILAQQHFNTLKKLCEKVGIDEKVRIALLTGKDKGKIKKEKLSLISEGEIDIVIGTHALFQDNVKFKNLVLSVIDEQHKFGVCQRLSLANKNTTIEKCNVLAMSATPIPRTLAMCSFGDMDLSVIDEMPPNRKYIETKVLGIDKLQEMLTSVKNKLETGELQKIYWVCPLVEESEKVDLTAVITRYEFLSSIFGEKVALLHGKMKADEKNSVIQDFANPDSNVKILVATSVVEVGVDVPEATLMIIESSERFGLSSLHQLRGRIGRGSQSSMCILLHGFPISKLARERLSVMKNTNNGFEIAEKDLKLRGAGDILGVKQSGVIDFKFADFVENYNDFVLAYEEAKNIIDNDLKNNTERWKNLQVLLQLFDYTM